MEDGDNDWVHITTMRLVTVGANSTDTYYLTGNCVGTDSCEYDQVQVAAIFIP